MAHSFHGVVRSAARSTVVTLEMIKWEHSVFALPFALSAAVLAVRGIPRLVPLGWIVLCMVSARTAAMAFNRLVDAELDGANPRTAGRALPAGLLSPVFVGLFTAAFSAIFIFSAAMLNHLTLLLAPVALAVVLGYSYMKRVTRWSHLVLGLALGIAPSAAWIALRGSLDPRIVVMTVMVMLWVAGFDVLYACQDFEHDRGAGLHSIPQAFGLAGAFRIARLLHGCVVLLAFWLDSLFSLGMIGYAGTAVVALLLAYEHSIVGPNDLRRMNAAFFLLNGVIAGVFFLFVSIAVFVGRT